MADLARASWEAETEVGEELRGGRFRRGYHPESYLGGDAGPADGNDDVDALDGGDLLEELAGAGPETFREHPLLESAPQGAMQAEQCPTGEHEGREARVPESDGDRQECDSADDGDGDMELSVKQGG
jgi:hypothetical protein